MSSPGLFRQMITRCEENADEIERLTALVSGKRMTNDALATEVNRLTAELDKYIEYYDLQKSANERLIAENELLVLQAAHAENEGYDAAIAKIGQKDARNELLERVLEAAEEAQRWIHPDASGYIEEDLRLAIAACEHDGISATSMSETYQSNE